LSSPSKSARHHEQKGNSSVSCSTVADPGAAPCATRRTTACFAQHTKRAQFTSPTHRALSHLSQYASLVTISTSDGKRQ